MKRRDFICGIGALPLLGGCEKESQKKIVSRGKKFKWKLALAVPKTLKIWGPGLIHFSKRIKEMSGGRLEINVFGGGELVPPLEIFDAVKNGTIEMGHAAGYYWQGRIPAAVFFTAVPFGMNTQGMYAWLRGADGQDLYDELYAEHGVKPFPLGSTGIQMGGWFRKEINSVADFKGLKMRMPGLGGKVITRLGANAVNYPAQELFTNLSTGVIDATEWVGPYHDYLMGFYKAASYYYAIGWHEPGSILELTINKKAWESLDSELQSMVIAAAHEVDAKMYAQWLAKDSEFFLKLQKNPKIKMRSFPKAVTDALKKEAKVVVEEVRDSSPLARKIYDSFYAFKKQFEVYQRANELTYLNL